MNNKLIGILLISLFLFSNISQVLADDDRSYSITNANFFIDVEEDGKLHILESLDYSFDGEFNGVYRDIPLKEGQSIENINITTNGAYSDYEITNESGYSKIKIYLYADEAKTQKISNTNVNVNIEYDFINSVNIYRDTAELQHKLWGEEWDVDVDKVHGEVTYKSPDGVKYWINPYYSEASTSWENNTLIIQSGPIKEGEYLEIRSTIPLNQFSNPIYANKIDHDGLSEIIASQEDYKNQAEFEDKLFSIFPIILLALLIVFPIIYFKYGREPKINYSGIYEREPPSDYSPIFVNAMFDGKVGTLDEKAFQSGVMDLINKKCLLLLESDESNIKLKINNDTDFKSLKDYESGIINILKDFESDGIIDFNKMKSNLSNTSYAKRFSENYNLWKSDFEKIHVDSVMYKYFIDDGYTYFRAFSVILAIASIILLYFAFNSITPNSFNAIIIGFFTLAISAICFFLPDKIAGRWTKYGMEENKKWENFKKYLNDFSLMKEYPPSSIVIWNQYLVYASSLGVAKNVKKAMDFHISSDTLENDSLYAYHSYGGNIMLYSAMSAGFSTANPSSDGGVGGPGGGSGGGGGGAF
ncbi:MAG: DUF2207 domain-containing protein [Methanobacteriaceae archaeon]|jgi:uncharacterized membrane protein|nr:DUF2207 domain-containing protein [Methanobacteriaceae archaeon]